MLAAVTGGAVAKKLRLPVIVGYLVAGVVIGTAFKIRFGLGSLTPALAELGVAMLLFSIGLEFPLKKFSKVGRPGILGAVFQILATIIVSLVIFTVFFNFSPFKAMFFGSLISLSSTAVVSKILADRGDLESTYGELMITWLLVQDLAVIPLMVIFSSSSGQGSVFLAILLALLKAAVFLLVVLLVGKRLVPALFSKLAFLGSRELLTVASFTSCVLLAFATYSFGLSFAVGAFLGGLLLTSADLSHEIHGIVRPLRDLFAAVFFVSLGFLVDISSLGSNLTLIITLLVLVLVIKFAITFGIARFLGYPDRLAFTATLGLDNVGEFAFILAALGLSQELITPDFYQIILAVVLLSLIIAPIAFEKSHFLYSYVWGKLLKSGESTIHKVLAKSAELSNHVVLVGYGRVGRQVAESLVLANTPFIIVDYNLRVLKEARRQGFSYVYGDPTCEEVLRAAGVSCARAIILAVPEVMAEELIIKEVRRLNGQIKIYCRAHTKEDADFLRGFSPTAVIEPELEAARAISGLLND